jgi:hypothetical protein
LTAGYDQSKPTKFHLLRGSLLADVSGHPFHLKTADSGDRYVLNGRPPLVRSSSTCSTLRQTSIKTHKFHILMGRSSFQANNQGSTQYTGVWPVANSVCNGGTAVSIRKNKRSVFEWMGLDGFHERCCVVWSSSWSCANNGVRGSTR